MNRTKSTMFLVCRRPYIFLFRLFPLVTPLLIPLAPPPALLFFLIRDFSVAVADAAKREPGHKWYTCKMWRLLWTVRHAKQGMRCVKELDNISDEIQRRLIRKIDMKDSKPMSNLRKMEWGKKWWEVVAHMLDVLTALSPMLSLLTALGGAAH